MSELIEVTAAVSADLRFEKGNDLEFDLRKKKAYYKVIVNGEDIRVEEDVFLKIKEAAEKK